MLSAAHILAWTHMGWHIFPIKPGGKEPITKRGVKDASPLVSDIRKWAKKYPRANWAVACGPSGLVVVDIDSVDTFKELPVHFPATLSARTGSGGIHLYYKQPEGVELRPTVGRLPGYGKVEGVDLRAGASYVLVPPSETTGPYKWLNNHEVAEAPEWLRPDPPREKKATPPKEPTRYANAALTKTMQRIRQAVKGERNHTLNREVFGLRPLVEQGHLDCELVRQKALEAARDIGLSDYEAERTINSALGIQEG